MDTLYDLLGALPRDNAEDLRAAFRRAKVLTPTLDLAIRTLRSNSGRSSAPTKSLSTRNNARLTTIC
jgi:hypothetical protein